MLGGFSDRKREVEAENLREAERANAREAEIFKALLSSPDTEIQSLAAAGLLESAQPRKRKSGLRGWVGEMSSSPTFQRIQSLIGTPVQTSPGTLGTLAHTEYPAAARPGPSLTTPPPAQAPAGTPARSLTEPGAPPAAVPVPSPRSIPATVGTPPSFGPRKLFLSPDEAIGREAESRERGEVRGRIAGRVEAGFTPDAARQLEQRQMSGAAGQTYAEGEIVADPSSPTGYSQTLYLRADPTVRQRIPASAPTAGSSRAPNVRELIAHEKFGKPGEDPRAVLQRLSPIEIKAVLDEEVRRGGQIAAEQTTARGTAAAAVPLTTAQRAAEIGRMADDWRTISAPHTIMQRQLSIMKTAMAAAERDPRSIPSASEAIIVSFERMLDPNSVVREAEARRPGSMQSLIGRVEAAIKQIREGGAGITLDNLRPYVQLSDEIMAATQSVMAGERSRIDARAREFGIDPALITGTPGVGTPPPGSATPAAPGGPTQFRKDAQGNWVLP